MAETNKTTNKTKIAIKEADKKYTNTQITKKIAYAKKTNPKKYERLMKTYRDWHPSDEEQSDEEQSDEEPQTTKSKDTFILTDNEYDTIRKALNIDFQEEQIETLQKLFSKISNNEKLLHNVVNFFKDRSKLEQQNF